jgi:lipopolysaccharide export system protein LptC
METPAGQILSSNAGDYTGGNRKQLLNQTLLEVKKSTKGLKIRKHAGYSRYVFLMKFLLPTIALGLIGLIFLWPQINIGKEHFLISFEDIKSINPEEPNMINARFVGTDAKSQPFSITADLAKNVMINSASIELEMPKADIGIKHGAWLAVTANNGVYDSKAKTLDLIGAVNLFHDSGYEFNTKRTMIDLESGTADSRTEITGQGPFGNITAEGLLLMNKGNRFLFIGKTKLIIHLDPQKIKSQ